VLRRVINSRLFVLNVREGRIRPGCHGLRLKCNTGQRRTRTRAGWVGRNCSCRGGRVGVQRLVEIGGGLVAGVHRFVETDILCNPDAT
jgi:hypothetical protein